MKALQYQSDYNEVIARLRRLSPQSERRWGRMTADQMVCRLSDSFRNMLGERAVISVSPEPRLVQRTALKWVALYAPLAWPRGIRTHWAHRHMDHHLRQFGL